MSDAVNDTIAPTTFIMGDPFAQEVAGPNVRLNVVTPIIEIGNGWLRVIALASTQDAAVKIVAALQQKSPDSGEVDALRWALEEIIQHAEPGSPPWAVIPDHLIEQAKRALSSGQREGENG